MLPSSAGPNGPDLLRRTDLLPGVAAAAAFLFLVFAMSLTLWLCAVLSAVVYVGVWLVFQSAEPHRAPRATEEELIRQLSARYPHLPNPATRQRIAAICAQAARFLEFVRQDPERGAAWQGIVGECLQTTLRIVDRYGELAPFFEDPAHQSVPEVDALLDQVAATFASLRKRLLEEGAADLSEETQAFRSTLHALDEVTVSNRTGEIL